MLMSKPVLPEDPLSLTGQVVRPDLDGGTAEIAAQEIMFNTRTNLTDETRNKPDVATMRISSFMINRAGKNSFISGQKMTEEGTAGQPKMNDSDV